MADVWAYSEAKGNDRLVLLAIADHANDEDRQAWPSIAHLAGKCRLSRSTVKRALARLALNGELRLVVAGDGTVNRYAVWDPVHLVDPVQIEPGSPGEPPTRFTVDPPPGSPTDPGVVHSCEPLNHHEPSKRKEPSRREPSVSREDGFNGFWSTYPKRVAKAAAQKAWQALKPGAALQATILAAIAQQATWPQWQRDGGQYIPHPATWLHRRQWEDEAPTVKTPLLTPRGQQALDAGKEWLRRTTPPPKGTALVRIP